MIRWGIVGPGRIAAKVVEDFAYVPGAVAVAVASPLASNGPRRSPTEHRLETAYGSYARDHRPTPDIDALYIATPHPQHHADRGGRARRPARRSWWRRRSPRPSPGPRRIIAAARGNGVFAMEAMWTRFQPAIVVARALIEDGAIGEVRQVQADLGVDRPYDPTDRLFDPAQGGGAMLDLGVYVVSIAQYFLGTPDRVEVTGSLAPTGVDCGGRAAARLRRRTGGDACSARCATPRPGQPGSSAPTGGSRSRRASTIPTGSCCTATVPSPR